MHVSTERPDFSLDALAAAALAAEGNTQSQIAKILNLSQSAVSRLLRGVQQEYIRTSFLWDQLPPSVQDEVRGKISQREICRRIAQLARKHNQATPAIHVVPLPEVTEVGPQFETFAGRAATILRELLEDVKGTVGVAWGSTLWHTVQALGLILPKKPLRADAPIEFVPLCGDPLMDSERYADRTSSRIVVELSKIINGDQQRPPWLGLVPAFIPRIFRGDEIRVIDRLIDLVPQYGRIFGPRIKGRTSTPAPAAGDLQMIITAADPSQRPLGFGRNPLFGLSEAESKLLTEHIHGDIGGVLIPRLTETSGKKGHEFKPHPLVQELTKRWTGLRIEHLKACARRASSEQTKSRPGVILLSFGVSHVEIVLEAVRQGLANQIIIGSDLENAIEAALPPTEN